MTPNPQIMKSIEQLQYRVTVGDVAAQAGLELNLAQQGLLALASEAGGHLQVAETGEIVYLFPSNFRGILRNKYWRLQIKEWWDKIWRVVFYLIRISFGILLIASIVLMMVAIAAIVIAVNSKSDSDSDSNSSYGGGGNFFFMPNFSSLFWVFYPNYYNRYEYEYEHDSRQYRQPLQRQKSRNNLNFLEAIYSFLFGDGDPNFNLEERRWQEIGTVIRNHKGAVVAEQIAPYLDNINRYNQESEDYMLPVLAKFNGYPEVSPQGEIIYYFPELQVTAQKRSLTSVAFYLQEKLWRFSQAGSGQILLAIGLGGLNVILALVLGSLLRDIAVSGGLVGFVNGIYALLLGYAIAFLGIPLIRYFWVQWRNSKIEARNQQRQARTEVLQNPDPKLQQKLAYTREFAAEKVITDADITYSTEQDLLEQEIERSDQIDQEWQRRLNEG